MEVNAKGQTLTAFLEAYDPSGFPPVFVTADAAVLDCRKDGLYVLLIRRGNHPYIHRWAMPGGFVEQNESPAEAAARELREETGLQNVPLRQCGAFGEPDRDPRARIVTVGHWGLLPKGADPVRAGDDAAGADWFRIGLTAEEGQTQRTLRLTLQSETVTLTGAVVQQRDSLGWYTLPKQTDSALAADHDQVLVQALLGLRRCVKEPQLQDWLAALGEEA